MAAEAGGAELYTENVVTAVCAHMNSDHVEDNVLIVRSLGSQPDATEARMTDMGPAGAVFTAVVDGSEVRVDVPWSGTPTERSDIRAEVVKMYHDACEQLGLEPRAAGEH